MVEHQQSVGVKTSSNNINNKIFQLDVKYVAKKSTTSWMLESENIDENLMKREAFAVSLRKEKKLKIIAQRRESILKRLNLS